MRQMGWLFAVLILPVVLVASDAVAQPRGTSARSQSGPALPPSGHQTEPVDLNEGKSPAELFKAGCSVCHQSPAGLAKGRRESELVSFLRQHYTSSVQHAGALAGYVASAGPGRAAPTAAVPSRQTPVERPPASVGRRTPDDDRKEAAKPQEPTSRRKPPVAAARTPPAPSAAVEVAPAVEPAPAAPEPSTAASAPPVEEKPAAPQIPL